MRDLNIGSRQAWRLLGVAIAVLALGACSNDEEAGHGHGGEDDHAQEEKSQAEPKTRSVMSDEQADAIAKARAASRQIIEAAARQDEAVGHMEVPAAHGEKATH